MWTILLVGAYLLADEKIPLSGSFKRALYAATIASSVVASILYPPKSPTLLTYSNAFLSVAFALRAVELLISNQPGHLKRLVKVHENFISQPVYIWTAMPPALTFSRFLYIFDLLLNPRGIGWAHGSKKYLPHSKKLDIKPGQKNGFHKPTEGPEERIFILAEPNQSRLTFLANETVKLIIAYFVFDAYRTFLSFIISGVVHSAGTYAVSRDAHAVFMMMIFFILLPFFIAAQEAISTHFLERFLPDWFLVKAGIWILDAAYILWWGYHTAPWFFTYSMIPESLVSTPVPERWSIWHS